MTNAGESSTREAGASFSPEAKPAREQARTAAEQQKAVSATKAKALADAAQKAADELEPELPLAAAYIRGAAEKLQQASSALEKRSVDELAGALGDAARNRPAAVFGAAAIAGLAFSLLTKSPAAGGSGRPAGE